MVGTLLLSRDGYYVGKDGELPSRSSWDKQFVTDLVKGKTVICSASTLATIPDSMMNILKSIHVHAPFKADVNMGIDTFVDYAPDMLLVFHSTDCLRGGKRFDLTRLMLYNEYPINDTLTIYLKVR